MGNVKIAWASTMKKSGTEEIDPDVSSDPSSNDNVENGELGQGKDKDSKWFKEIPKPTRTRSKNILPLSILWNHLCFMKLIGNRFVEEMDELNANMAEMKGVRAMLVLKHVEH